MINAIETAPATGIRPAANPNASWSVTAQTLRANLAKQPADVAQLLFECYQQCHAIGLARKDFSAAIGCDDSVVYKLIKGKYVRTDGSDLPMPTKHAEAARAWLNEQRAHRPKSCPNFVETATARKVFEACRFARESRTPVFLYGPSHIGKTTALLHYSETHNHGRTPYFRMGEGMTRLGLLKQLCRGVNASHSGVNRDQLKQNLFAAISPDQTLLIDEFHQLLHTTSSSKAFISCVEVFRDLTDVVGCGLVLSMTNFGRDEIVRGRVAELEQTLRRGVHRFQLADQPLPSDIEPILHYHGLEMPRPQDRVTIVMGKEPFGEQPYALLKQLGKQEGLKAITERIRYAQRIARAYKADLTWQHVIEAHVRINHNATAPASDWK